MTCMEVADMMVYEFTKRVIVPVVAANISGGVILSVVRGK